jgi:hypothetical protein
MTLGSSIGLTVPLAWRKWLVAAALVAAAWPLSVSAQQTPAPAPAPATPAAPPQQQFQQSGEWAKLPRMQLERQFAGPLQDTVIQRLRDTVDGTVCYVYLPISVAHSPTTATGFVQYGPNTIGSINCIPTIPAPVAGRR